MNVELLPLFSTPVFVVDIEEDLGDISTFIKYFEYQDINVDGDNECATTKKLNVLEHAELLELKKTIIKHFNYIKNEVFKYTDTQFEITTSWGTRVGKNSTSHYHNHRNALYSGVFYFENYGKNNSFIEFSSFSKEQFDLNNSERNIFNSENWTIETKKNRLIIFPSNIYHRVVYKNCNLYRYSLAFNLIPTKSFGYLDSSVNINLVR